MITFIKILVLIAVLFLIVFPLLPIKRKSKKKKFVPIASLKFEQPNTRKNGIFILVALLELILFVLLFGVIEGLGDTIYNIPFLKKIFAGTVDKLGPNFRFVTFAIAVVIGNIIMIYGYVLLKKLFKKWVSDDEDEEEENKEKQTEKETDGASIVGDEQDDPKKKNGLIDDNVPVLDHVREDKKKDGKNEDDEQESAKKKFGAFAKAFFEGDQFQYSKPWVARIVSILQVFVILVDVLFVLLLALIVVSLLFPVSDGLYAFLIDGIKVADWYLYPFLSIIMLQEICNTFKTSAKPEAEQEVPEELRSEEEILKDNKLKLRSLAAALKKNFDEDHKLRFYPGNPSETTKFEYEFTNNPYRGALEYIQKTLAVKTGNRGQSYLECLDAMFNDEHVYFCASFYSEIGEYLIAYTYSRLLSGSRMIFVVSDKNKREALRKYVLNRLTKLTGNTEEVTWRVYTSEDRLDQADILIASPDDFKDDNIVENYPDFFEEVCNVVLIDADKVVSLESYLCPVLAIRLLNATAGRVKFVFLTTDLLRGFAASSLPKLFCLDKVLSFSSAGDNERVEYTLWNKESSNNRIYYKNGQKLMSLEGIIAEEAYKYGIDGIRVVTNSPIDHGERKILEEHDVEINEFHKEVPNINYMIYSDERSNLAAAIYACTRFKGERNSVAHIISKPYLLREYFMHKATKENFIRRSSYIQPRITEHAEKERLSLLKIFCRAATNDGMSVNEFVSEMKNAISISRIRGDVPLCKFCDDKVRFGNLDKMTHNDYAAYLIAALCDGENTSAYDSYGHCSKDFYILVDHVNHEYYSLTKEKFIIFKKCKEVFDRVFACNERVVLRLNDTNIGYLDTFPSRVPLEYVVGQSIIFNNAEYEIEQISKDNKIIFLRRENVAFKNCLDTVFLRRYKINSFEKIGQDGVLNNSESLLKEIRLTMLKTDFEGETYGFYNLMSNNQSLNFVRGVEGNPHLERDVVEKNKRYLSNGRVLRVCLSTGMECTDGMRILLAAVFNEFIKTMFPKAYRCIAICPVLEKPLEFNADNEAQTVTDKIKTLYPYLLNTNPDLVETDKTRMQFMFINDCSEDVGVFDWFYDKLASNVQELVINVYSYMFWLKSRPDLSHYIYFGHDKLPECFDLEGCCKLFEGYNLIISDDGKKNYQTAGEDVEEEQLRCSFCHNMMESGRYSFFNEDKTHYICADCMDVIGDEEQLKEVHNKVKKYLAINYPEVSFGYADVVFAGEKEKLAGLNEWFFRFDPDKRRIIVAYELPEKTLQVAILCGMIIMWQYDNDLMTEYSYAQLSYEHIKYLLANGRNVTADWELEHLDANRKENYDEIARRIEQNTKGATDNETAEGGETEGEQPVVDEHYTSFSFMIEIGAEIREMEEDVDYEDIEGDDFSDLLYDPNKTPRFWKRYIRLHEEDEDAVQPVALSDDDEQDEVAATEDLDDDAQDDMEQLDNDQTINSAWSYGKVYRPNSPMGDEDLDADLEIEDSNDQDALSVEDDLADDLADESLDDELDGEDLEADLVDEDQKDDEKAKQEEERKRRQQEKDAKKAEKQAEKEKRRQADKLEKERKRKEKELLRGQKKNEGIKRVPFEMEEEKNPRLRFYNEIVRHAYNYSEEAFSHEGVPASEVEEIFNCAQHDYPELFWLDSICWTDAQAQLIFRCKTAQGTLDMKQINQKLSELRSGAKFFTKGITKKTDPYQALLTIYKRLILTLDYDSKGLDAKIDRDLTKDDRLRSLHSAIVRHKTVCAGYAVAMQYLLQSVGIPCAYVVSELRARSGHAFNIVKLGKYCYYLDATWGDMSNTKDGDKYNDIINYSYCCVPYSDFIKANPNMVYNHIPNHEMYPWFNKDLKANRHEYYRYHKAFISRYNEDDLVAGIVGFASRYDPKEDGRFTISFRCTDKDLANQVAGMLLTSTTYQRIISKAKKVLGKNKTACKLLDLPVEGSMIDDSAVVTLIYKKIKK